MLPFSSGLLSGSNADLNRVQVENTILIYASEHTNNCIILTQTFCLTDLRKTFINNLETAHYAHAKVKF